jgi:hypothetical protein
MNARSELLVIHDGGQVIAYAGVQLPSSRGRRTLPYIQELAGSRTALAAALFQIGRRYDAAEIAFITQPGEPEIRRVAAEKGWKAIRQPFSGTLGVIDPPALLAALHPLFEERCREPLQIAATEECARFAAHGEQYEIAAPGPLAALLFGGDTDEARRIPPLRGRMGELLRKILPLPLFWYGYSYV